MKPAGKIYANCSLLLQKIARKKIKKNKKKGCHNPTVGLTSFQREGMTPSHNKKANMKNQKTVWHSKTESGKSVKVCKLDNAWCGYKWAVLSETGYRAEHFKLKREALNFANQMVSVWNEHGA